MPRIFLRTEKIPLETNNIHIYQDPYSIYNIYNKGPDMVGHKNRIVLSLAGTN